MPSVHKVDPKSRDLLEDHHPCRWASRLPKMTGWQAARRDRGAGGIQVGTVAPLPTFWAGSFAEGAGKDGAPG